MSLENYFHEKARANKQKIVLPEGNEPRIIKAAAQILEKGIADLIILGKKEEIFNISTREDVNIDEATIIDPTSFSDIEKFTDILYEARKHKGITREEAGELVKDPLYLGTLLVHSEQAHGLVAGSINATGNVLRPAFQIIKTKPDISVVSGAMIMVVPESEMGADGTLLFADCAVNPAPDSEQLAEIAISSAETAELLLNLEPVVALLSFSTKGSAQHQLVDKVRKAVEITRQKAPEIECDGELQADAALVKEVAQTKAPESSVGGRANTLVFPDLQAGNIGYKLVERLGRAKAIGPVLQGMARPVNDLSRGCSVDDIINVVAITSIQAQNQDAI